MNKMRTVLYVGVTNDLTRRTWEHQNKVDKKSFTQRYNLDKLVYFEDYQDINQAIVREKQIKGWSRAKKLKLIESMNLNYKDLWENIIK